MAAATAASADGPRRLLVQFAQVHTGFRRSEIEAVALVTVRDGWKTHPYQRLLIQGRAWLGWCGV